MRTAQIHTAGSSAELNDTELDRVVGGDQWSTAGGWTPWGLNAAAPTPDQWRAWGQQLAADYQANHSTHLGQPLTG